MKYNKVISAWVIVFHAKDDTVLILRRAASTNNPNLLNFPGGKTDGDRARVAAARELWEEAGIRVRPEELVKLPKRVLPISDTRYFIYYIDEYPRVKLDLAESSHYEWMPRLKVRNLKHDFHYKSLIPIDFGVLDHLPRLRYGKASSVATSFRTSILATATNSVAEELEEKSVGAGHGNIDKTPNPTGAGSARLQTRFGVPQTHISMEISMDRLVKAVVKAAVDGVKGKADAHWWDMLDPKQREAFLSEHPNSIYGHEDRMHKLLTQQGMKINKSYDSEHGLSANTGKGRLTHFYDPKSRTHGVLSIDKTDKGHVGHFSVRTPHELKSKSGEEVPQGGKDYDWWDNRHTDNGKDRHAFKVSSPRFPVNSLKHIGHALDKHRANSLKHGFQGANK